MKLELPCAIVRDLLPSYAESLTEAETTAAVKDHLETCEDCRRRYETMTGGDPVPPDTEREVDYLKNLRRKNTKKVVTAVVLTLALVLAGVYAKLFWIGSPCDGSSVALDAELSQDHTGLELRLEEMNSGSAITKLKVETKDGVARVTGREVLINPFHSRDEANVLTLPLDGVRRVEAFGTTIWQDGLLIDDATNRLLAHKTPYAGNAPALGQLVSDLDLDVPATLELQTAHEPYGMTLHFSKTLEEDRRFLAVGSTYVLLALVDNLGEVHWDDPSGYSGSLTVEEANQTLPGLVEAYNQANGTQLSPLDDVKACGAGFYELQLLRDLLDL